MKTAMIALLSSMVLALGGCASKEQACQVFSPAAVSTPTTENAQRVNTNATGNAMGNTPGSQDCG